MTPTSQGDGLFDVVRSPTAPDMPTRVEIVMPEGHVRGPGPLLSTGPGDARAPRYWVEEAERFVVARVAAGYEVTSDDVRAHCRNDPSATGAALGALFRRLGQEGKIVLRGHRPSTRPQARGRVVGRWAAP